MLHYHRKPITRAHLCAAIRALRTGTNPLPVEGLTRLFTRAPQWRHLRRVATLARGMVNRGDIRPGDVDLAHHQPTSE